MTVKNGLLLLAPYKTMRSWLGGFIYLVKLGLHTGGSGMVVVGRVSSKGELFPPKELREAIGLKPHMKVLYRVQDGKLIVEPIPSIEDVLKEAKPVKISVEEFYRFRKELSRRLGY